MSKRRRVSKRGSKRLFSTTAAKTNRLNLAAGVMRGGYRI